MWWWARLDRLPPLVLDIVLVLAAGGAISISISAAQETPSREPDALAYGLGLTIAALLFFRRRWPLTVLGASAAVLMAYYWLNYPGFVPAIPFAVPLYTAAAAGRTGWAVVVSSIWGLGPLPYRLFVDPEPVARVLNDTLRDVAFFAAIVLLGIVVKARREHAEEVAERLRRAESERERVAQELRVARLVQEQFLPSELPDLPGWQIATFYRSATEVGGDFYSFAELPAGKVGISVGDVTDKGAPAALVMATTQALLGTETSAFVSPSATLEKVNEVLVLNTPANMFVTCLYIVLDPATGEMEIANAGHNLPYVSTEQGVGELKATGMPLGLMSGSVYEATETTVPRGARLLLHSDGLSEAHNSRREMFGLPRIAKIMENVHGDEDLISALLDELDRFTGVGWEQEDDITLVTVERSRQLGRIASSPGGGNGAGS